MLVCYYRGHIYATYGIYQIIQPQRPLQITIGNHTFPADVEITKPITAWCLLITRIDTRNVDGSTRNGNNDKQRIKMK